MKFEIIPDAERPEHGNRAGIKANAALLQTLQEGKTVRVPGPTNRGYLYSLGASAGMRVSVRKDGDNWIVWKTGERPIRDLNPYRAKTS